MSTKIKTKKQKKKEVDQQPKRKAPKPGLAGNLYEVKLSSLYICRGLILNFEFEIGTEIEEGIKFDDIIFKYVDEAGKKFCVIVQAKHASNVNEKIVIDHLLIDHYGDFGLSKYYYSYQKAKRNSFFDDLKIKYAMIITNRKFDERRKISNNKDSWKTLESIKNMVEEVPIGRDNFELGLVHDENNGKIYRFKIDVVLPALKNALVDYTLQMIATELVDSLTSKINRTEDFIEKYYNVLVNEVIDLESNQFRKNCFDDSAELKQLREEMKSWIRKKKGGDMGILEKKFNFMKNYEVCKERKEQTFAQIIDDEDIKEFLKIFVVATEEPGEKELGKFIEDELKKGFFNDQIPKILHVIMENWSKGEGIVVSKRTEDPRFISSENIKELLTAEDRKINEKLFLGHLVGLNRVNMLNFHFDDNVIKNNLDAFLNSNMKVLDIISNCELLTCIKIHKYCENRCIITKLSSLIESSNILLKSFVNKFCDHRLLAIECDVDKTCDSVKDELINLLTTNDDKKVIFTRSEKNRFSSEFKDKFPSQFQQCFDEKFGLNQLTEDSQVEFLKKCSVKFQGHSVKLVELSNANIKKSINEEYLLKFLKEKEFKIGTPTENIQKYYINREFVGKIKIDENATAFVFGFNENSFSREWKYVDADKSLIHYLTRDEKRFIDQQKGEIDKICLLRIENGMLFSLNNTSNFSMASKTVEKKINEICKRKVFLLASDPGMGKSSVFNNLCHRTKSNDPTSWVSKIDLNSSSRILKKILENKKSDYDNLMIFLSVSLNIRRDERDLFQNFLKAGKVVLFFDGFDEISPTYKHVTIKLINTLNDNFDLNRIFISSRPHDHILDSLNNTFEVSSYELMPFSNVDQLDFLEKFWKFNYDLRFDIEKLHSFANKLIRSFKDSLKSSNYVDFLETPLHTMMIAMTYKADFKKFISSESDDKLLSEKLSNSLNLSSLYKNFIEIKCYEKFQMDRASEISTFLFENFYKEQIKKYQILSLAYLFEGYDLNSFLKDEERDIINSSRIGIDRIGIIITISSDSYHFIHNTYAEYFAAVFIVNNMNRESVENFFLSEVLTEDNKMICNFVNEILCHEGNKTFFVPEKNSRIEKKTGEKIHLAIHNSWQEIVKYLLKYDVDLYHINNDHENIFHLACESSNRLVLKMILEKIENDPETLKDFIQNRTYLSANKKRQTPLSLITAYGTLDNINKMFTMFKINISENVTLFVDGANRNILHHCVSNPHIDVLKYVIEYLKNKSELFESLIRGKDSASRSPLLHAAYQCNAENTRFLFDTMIERNMLDDIIESVDDKDNTIFHYAALNENDEMLSLVVDQLKKQPKVFESLIQRKNISGCSPLQCAIYQGNEIGIRLIFSTLNEFNILDAAIKIVDVDNNTILHYAAMNEKFEALSFVVDQLKNCNYHHLFDHKGMSGRTLLLHACSQSNIANIQFLFSTLKELDLLNCAMKSVDSESSTILHLAAVNANNEVLPFLVERLKDQPEIFESLIQSKGFEGRTPLLCAARQGSIYNIQFLFGTLKVYNMLDEAVKFVDCQNSTILHMAAANEEVEVLPFVFNQLKILPGIFESLIQNKGPEDRTPLLYAVSRSNITNIRFLFNILREYELFDDAVKSVDCDNSTILHLAAVNINNEVLPFVVDQLKCQPEFLESLFKKKGIAGCSPLLCAARQGNVVNVRFLFNTLIEFNLLDDAVKFVDNDENTILHLAAANEKNDVLQFIVEQLKNQPETFESLIEHKGFEGRTPLLYAAIDGNVTNIRYLFSILEEFNFFNKAVMSVDKENATILHLASLNSDDKVLPFFIDQIKNQPEIFELLIQSKSIHGRSPLLYATRDSSVGNVRFLFSTLKEFNILDDSLNAIDHEKDTILHLATTNEKADVLPFVVEKLKSQPEVFHSLIQSKGFADRSPLLCASAEGNKANVRFLLRTLREINLFDDAIRVIDVEENNILHLATTNEKIEVLPFVFEELKSQPEIFHSLIQSKNLLGCLPLLYAALHGNIANVRFLFSAMREINLLDDAIKSVDYDECTILHLAAGNKKAEVFLFIVKELQSQSEIFHSLIQSKSLSGCSPLLYAAFLSNIVNVRFLFNAIREIDLLDSAIKCADYDKDTILHLAVTNENADVFPFIVEELKSQPEIFHSLIQSKGYADRSPLLCGALLGNIVNFSLLFNTMKEIDLLCSAVKSVDGVENTILHLAAGNKNAEVFPFVINQLKILPGILESLIQSKGIGDHTPLLYAIFTSNVTNIRILFSTLREFNLFEDAVKSVDNVCNTIFHLAAASENDEVLPIIVDELKMHPEFIYSLIQTKGFHGRTPFMCAVIRGNIKIIWFLISTLKMLNLFDDTVRSVDNDNNTILHLAAANENIDVLPFVVDLLKNQPEIFHLLIRSKGFAGRSPLLCAIFHGNVSNIWFLFSVLRMYSLLDDTVKSVDNDNNTILHLAAANENVDVLPFVVDQLKTQPEVIISLIQSTGFEGRTPLLHAVSVGNVENINFILIILKTFNLLENSIISHDIFDRNILQIAALNSNADVSQFFNIVFEKYPELSALLH